MLLSPAPPHNEGPEDVTTGLRVFSHCSDRSQPDQRMQPQFNAWMGPRVTITKQQDGPYHNGDMKDPQEHDILGWAGPLEFNQSMPALQLQDRFL